MPGYTYRVAGKSSEDFILLIMSHVEGGPAI